MAKWRPRKPDAGETITGPAPAPIRGVDIDQFEVIEWCPNDTGEDPTQVWLIMRTDKSEIPVVLRFKGPDTLDNLVRALTRHRIGVFGEYRQ